MESESTALSRVPKFTAQLLIIANENDRSKALMNNYALLSVLKLSWAMSVASRSNQREKKLASLLQVQDLASHFLPFVGQVLQYVQNDINRLYRNRDSYSHIPIVSDYDSFAIQALGQCFADVAWPEREASDYLGPKISQVLDEYESKRPLTIWGLTLTSYIGNILQFYFAGVRSKQRMNNLSTDFDVRLRNKDAKRIVYHALKQVRLTDNLDDNIETVMDALRGTIIELFQITKVYK